MPLPRTTCQQHYPHHNKNKAKKQRKISDACTTTERRLVHVPRWLPAFANDDDAVTTTSTLTCWVKLSCITLKYLSIRNNQSCLEKTWMRRCARARLVAALHAVRTKLITINYLILYLFHSNTYSRPTPVRPRISIVIESNSQKIYSCLDKYTEREWRALDVHRQLTTQHQI